MRITDADREALLERLKAHAVTGAIDAAELERRVEIAVRAADAESARMALDGLPPLASAGTGGARPRWWTGRGHGEADHAGPDWQRTAERFRDPRTDRVMRVWVDGGGGRHYLPDAD